MFDVSPSLGWDAAKDAVERSSVPEQRQLLRRAVGLFKDEPDPRSVSGLALMDVIAGIVGLLQHDAAWYRSRFDLSLPMFGIGPSEDDVLDNVPCIWVWHQIPAEKKAHSCVMIDALGRHIISLHAGWMPDTKEDV